MDCYNLHLYHLRIARKQKRKEFARFLGLRTATYASIEKGYLKPNKKQTAKISAALDEDFSLYLQGNYSYPLPLPLSEESKMHKWFLNLCGHLVFRIVLLVFLLGAIGVLSAGGYYAVQYNKHSQDSFSDNYVSFYDNLKKNGSLSLSLTSDLKRPEFFTTDGSDLYSLQGSYDEDEYTILDATATFHTDDYRLTYQFSFGNQPVLLEVNYVVYDTALSYRVNYYESEKDVYTFSSFLDYSSTLDSSNESDQAAIEAIIAMTATHLADLNSNFDSLITTNTGMNYSFFEGLIPDYYAGNRRLGHLSALSLVLLVLGAISAASLLFFLIYCLIYGRKRKKTSFETVEVSSRDLEKLPNAKTDFRFTPFLPETFFEIIGICFVFFGSLRILYYLFTFFGVIQISGNDFTDIPNTLFYLFMIGMFLLYFVDFDIFLDDKRVFSNVFLYLIIFVLLYFLESLIMQAFANSNNLILNELSKKVTVPNNFGTITCYFLMMLTLFYTPKRIKTHKGLVAYRLLTIIPVGIIISFTLIYHYANTLWNWNLSIPVLYLFASEKTQFSLLCVTYLLGLYFLKLFYEKKYGKEKALALMNGNRFLFMKNAIAAGTVFIIGLLEFILKGNSAANDLGLGKYPYLILLAPALLFYHPHLGERNKVVDSITMGFYVFALVGGYIIIAVPLLVMMFLSI
jgi:DNA-binding XRE family transcriptional regulator